MTIFNALPNTLTNGTTADATQVMANFNQLVSNGNSNAAHNGANSDITSLSGLTTPLSGAQGGTLVFIGGTSTGTANAQVVATTTPNSFTLTTGNVVAFLAGFTNTGATTLNTNSTGATNVFRRTSGGVVALVGGEIVFGNLYFCQFDGTQFQILNPTPGQYINAQTGASYAVAAGDNGKLITRTNAGAMADTIGQASNTGSFPTGWWTEYQVLDTSTGAVTLTATTSTINGKSTLTIQPGQSVKIFSDGTNYFATRGMGLIAQIVSSETGAATTGTTVYPAIANSALTTTGGDQYMTLTLTPTNASSTLIVDVDTFFASNVAATTIEYGLFQDSNTTALASSAVITSNTTNTLTNLRLRHKFTPAGTSQTVLKFRAGQLTGSAATLTFNGVSGGQIFGGTIPSNITVTEVLP